MHLLSKCKCHDISMKHSWNLSQFHQFLIDTFSVPPEFQQEFNLDRGRFDGKFHTQKRNLRRRYCSKTLLLQLMANSNTFITSNRENLEFKQEKNDESCKFLLPSQTGKLKDSSPLQVSAVHWKGVSFGQIREYNDKWGGVLSVSNPSLRSPGRQKTWKWVTWNGRCEGLRWHPSKVTITALGGFNRVKSFNNYYKELTEASSLNMRLIRPIKLSKWLTV